MAKRKRYTPKATDPRVSRYKFTYQPRFYQPGGDLKKGAPKMEQYREEYMKLRRVIGRRAATFEKEGLHPKALEKFRGLKAQSKLSDDEVKMWLKDMHDFLSDKTSKVYMYKKVMGKTIKKLAALGFTGVNLQNVEELLQELERRKQSHENRFLYDSKRLREMWNFTIANDISMKEVGESHDTWYQFFDRRSIEDIRKLSELERSGNMVEWAYQAGFNPSDYFTQ